MSRLAWELARFSGPSTALPLFVRMATTIITLAPHGYYGPDWFVNGVFIGAGLWFHGYYGRGYYGRPYYGRGGYNQGFTARIAPAFRGGSPTRAFRGANSFYAGGGFRSGAGGFHGGRR